MTVIIKCYLASNYKKVFMHSKQVIIAKETPLGQ